MDTNHIAGTIAFLHAHGVTGGMWVVPLYLKDIFFHSMIQVCSATHRQAGMSWNNLMQHAVLYCQG